MPLPALAAALFCPLFAASESAAPLSWASLAALAFPPHRPDGFRSRPTSAGSRQTDSPSRIRWCFSNAPLLVNTLPQPRHPAAP